MRTLCPFDKGLLRLINTPSLRELDITVTEVSEDELELFKRALADHLSMQRLETLSLKASNSAPFLDVELLSRLRHLRYLKLDCSRPIELARPIEFSRLRHLAALPNLERLTICLHSWKRLDLPTPITFSALRSFEMSCYEYGVIGNLLAHVEFPCLHTFSVFETHDESHNLSQKLTNHLRTLVVKCPSLTTFRWSSKQATARGFGYLGSRQAVVPLAGLISPLLAHRALRHFSLSFRGPIVPHTPADLRMMAEAWPDLETFNLGDEVDEGYDWAERFRVPVVHFDPSAVIVGEWGHRPPAPHWLDELLVQGVVVPCSRGDRSEDDEDRRREDVVRFRRGTINGFGALGILLAHVDAPRLLGFSISELHSDFFTMSKELPDHLHTLLAKYPSLTAFEWDSTQDSELKRGYIGDRRANAPLADLVAPLLSHREMQSFTVRLDGPLVPYSPADFRAFAEAWPGLKTFLPYTNYDDSVRNGVQQRADVESVVAFARHCPSLRSLDIPRVVQFESDPSVDSVRLPSAPHCLQELCVYSVRLPGESSEVSRHSEFAGQFRGLMMKIFPHAIHRIY
ncbi:hypothetical protein GSI_11537 [Ganoderma sinense ZZ0214-1]|uniref:F-box domain-containing protein n=1 Tax=Ganoderma sinense ZZ0214-1 TaxID=1077348 RepID=A0A2G8RWB6_9APHY|nr:hypothetical protein GSI_11537 [Ganoderma sinense ZZ0214-1]